MKAIARGIEQILNPQDIVEAVGNRWTESVFRELYAQIEVPPKKSFGQLPYAFRVREIELFIGL